MMALCEIAKILGGEIVGGEVLAPGPNHSAQDRSLAVRVSDTAPGGFITHSFAGDDDIACLNYVRERLGFGSFKPNGGGKTKPNGGMAAKPKPITTIAYDYRDPATGAFRYRKLRREYADGSKDFFFEKPSRNGGPPLLYGSERLIGIGEAPAWVVEGEKAVEA